MDMMNEDNKPLSRMFTRLQEATMRPGSSLVSGALLLAMLTVEASAQQRRDGALKVGDAATDFTVKDMEGKKSVKLSDLRGKPVVLIFGSCT